jgi:hypothetical protein
MKKLPSFTFVLQNAMQKTGAGGYSVFATNQSKVVRSS